MDPQNVPAINLITLQAKDIILYLLFPIIVSFAGGFITYYMTSKKVRNEREYKVKFLLFEILVLSKFKCILNLHEQYMKTIKQLKENSATNKNQKLKPYNQLQEMYKETVSEISIMKIYNHEFYNNIIEILDQYNSIVSDNVISYLDSLSKCFIIDLDYFKEKKINIHISTAKTKKTNIPDIDIKFFYEISTAFINIIKQEIEKIVPK